MTDIEKDKIDALRDLIEMQILPDIQKIKRGVYGDPPNDVEGLIHRLKSTEQTLILVRSEVTKIQQLKKKIIGFAVAGLALIQFLVSAIITWART
jgi:hypothetical protein